MADSGKLDLILSKLDKLGALESSLKELNRRITNVELTLENETNRNIQLIVENFIKLTNKRSS